MARLNMTRVLILIIIVLCCIINIHAESTQGQRGVAIVPDSEKKESSEKTEDPQQTNQDTVNIHTPDDSQTGDAINPQLLAALREINDDPSYLKPGEGELVDLSNFDMDPEKLEEMIEIFDWIESQLPKDDPQQIQDILNNVENWIDDDQTNDGNYTDMEFLYELTVLPDFLYQVDNGVDFMKMNGVKILLEAYKHYNPLSDIETKSSNTTLNYRIMSAIMDAIGVATQNNPNAIQYAHQSNLVSFIIDELNNIYLNYKNNDIPVHGQLMNKLVFTLSSITRQSDVGLQHLQSKHGAKVLYKCGKLLSKEINKGISEDEDNKDNMDRIENVKNMERSFKKLLTMVSDIVILNRNRLEYSRIFLSSGKWCGFMIEKGLMFHTDVVLQFINHGLERNYCVEDKMLKSLTSKLNKIIQQNTPKPSENGEEEDVDEDYSTLTQASNMLRYINQNFDIDKKTEL